MTVVLTGEATNLARLNPDEVKVSINLGGIYQAGSYSLDISSSDISLPEGIAFSSVVPSAINVVLEDR